MRNAAFTLVALAFLLAACGGGSGALITDGPEDPADAVKAFMAAMVAADAERMMPYLPQERREAFSESDRESLERNSRFLSEIEYEVISSELNEQGDSATVTVQLTVMGHTAPKEMTAVVENGRWVVVDDGAL